MPPTPGTTRRPAGGVPKRPTAIVNLQSNQRPSRIKGIIYGESGSGKTVLAGGAPKALFLSSDVDGTTSAKAFGSTADELAIHSWREAEEARDWLVRGKGYRDYEFIIVDTVDEVEELCWLSQLVSSDTKRASKYQPNKADYPMVWRKMKEWVMDINRLPVNCLYLHHVMRIDKEDDLDEDTTITLAMPLIGSTKRGDLSAYLCSQMSLVAYYRASTDEDGKRTRTLLTEAGPRWTGKDRHNVFGKGIVNPTLPNMLAKIEAGGGERPARPARRPRRTAAQ
jgi:hypothetical protein